MALLQVESLNKRFGGLKAVNDVSFTVGDGAIKAIIGPNGAGKTTLFNLIAGTLPPSSGAIFFNGDTLSKKKPYQIAELGIARTFQNIKMFNGMTALENVMVGRHVRSGCGFLSSMFHMPWTTREEQTIATRAMELLEFLDIAAFAHVEADSLAFGQQRAVELARALQEHPILSHLSLLVEHTYASKSQMSQYGALLNSYNLVVMPIWCSHL